MSQTTVNLGHVPVNRGEYSSSATYYRDNIVQYRNSSYICNIEEPDVAHPVGITGVAPYDSDPAVPNTGWAVFANDSNGVGEGVYNVSVDHTTDNQPKAYASLSAALQDVPQAKKKGGMEIKFIFNNSDYAVDKEEGLTIQPAGTLITSSPTMVDGTYKAAQLLTYFSTLPTATGAGNAVVYYKEVDGTYTTWAITLQSSDNKYVQYRLMSPTWSTVVTNWQGVDKVPTAGSRNFVESGGVADEISKGLGDYKNLANATQGQAFANYVCVNCKEGDTLRCKLSAENGVFNGNAYMIYKDSISSENELARGVAINSMFDITLSSDVTYLLAAVGRTNVLSSQSNILFEVISINGITDRIVQLESKEDSLEDDLGDYKSLINPQISSLQDSVSAITTSIGTLQKKVVGENNYLKGGWWLNNGRWVTDTAYDSSDYIKVDGGSTIKAVYGALPQPLYLLSYDAAKSLLRADNLSIARPSADITLPNDAAYIRYSWKSGNETYIRYGQEKIFYPRKTGIEDDVVALNKKGDTDDIAISPIGYLWNDENVEAGVNYMNQVYSGFTSGDVIYVRLLSTSIASYNISGNNGTYTIRANNLPNEWVKLVLTQNFTDIAARISGTNILSSEQSVRFEVLTADGLCAKLKEVIEDVPLHIGSVNSIIEIPSKIFGFAYKNTSAYLDKLNFMHRIYIEGIAKGNYPDLRVDGGYSVFAQIPPTGGAMSEGDYTKTIRVSCKGYDDANISVPISLSDPYNLVGKTMRIMQIGDSLTWDGIPCAAKAILDVMSNDYGSNDTLMVGNIKTTKDVVINGSSHQTTACSVGYGGWAISDLLRHFEVVRVSSSDPTILSGSALWDSLGLGTKTRNGVPSQTYVAYSGSYEDKVLIRDTPHGYYDADPTQALWNWIVNGKQLTTFTYNGVTYTFGASYSSADDAAQKAAIKYLCEHSANPFFDISTVESSNGNYAFSMSKYMERYKTLADDGVTRLVVGETAGTKVSDVYAYDVCEPTHVVIIMAHNGYTIVPDGIGDASDMALMAQLIKSYNSDIEVAIGAPRTPGSFNPNAYNWSGYYIENPFTEYLYNIYHELKDIASTDTNFTFLPLYPIQTIYWGADGKSIDTLDMQTRVRYVGDGNHARSGNSYLDVSSEIVAWLAYLFRTT